MRLDRLTARIRPRTPWEGLDLGFALGRRWFLVLWALWWLFALPIGLATALWLSDRPHLWILLIWWLKPLYEAPLLFQLSRALFGEPMSLRGLWQERRQVLPPGLVPSLLWRRLDLARSFHFPLIQLERLHGRERRQRRRVMQGRGSTASWLTIICVHLESILWASALVLALVLVPDGLPSLDAADALFDVESASYWVAAVLYWLSISIIAPFYVGAGFALYLTRRAELEAWDLELVFRHAGARENGRPRRAPAASGAAAMFVLLLCVASTLQAADVPTPEPQDARALIADILEQEDFGSKREIQTWVFVGQPGELGGAVDLPDWLRGLLDLLARGADLAATPGKWLLILLAAIALALVLRRILLELHLPERRRAAAPDDDQTLKRLGTTSAEDPPANVAAQVDDLIEAGHLRAALALLYRASLSRLVELYSLTIPASATESECLALVEQAQPAQEIELLRQLTATWQRLAYAHQRPETTKVAALLRDWQSWHKEGG